MIKFLVLAPRRPDFSREEFFKRWSEGHAAVVRKHAATLGIRRYIQSHRIESPEMDAWAAERGWQSTNYEGATEIWFDSVEAFGNAFSTPEGRAASMDLMGDEQAFSDFSQMIPVMLTKEHVII
jgi:uncharacterized protein (TIGR02118 family)